MKTAYFDCSSGISGDMCLGALIDAGVSLRELEKELGKIPLRGYKLTAKRVKRSHFSAVKVDVMPEKEVRTKQSGIRQWGEIEKIISDSSLPQIIRQKGLTIFKRIFQAEAKVHGKSLKKVHLHEIGAVDCMVDVFGTILGLDMLGIERVYSSPVNLGRGFIETEAGTVPVPAPATAQIIKNVPVYSRQISSELTTPTGAAIIKEISSGFGDIPFMYTERIGIGAGSRDFEDWPNVLRLFIGNLIQQKRSEDETVIVIEANIDDMNPQIFEYVVERLFEKGALDVYLTQVIMKKGRPGVKLTALCNHELKESLMKIVLEETTTIGLRFYEAQRRILRRQLKTRDTSFGKVRVKISRLGKDITKVTPEYEDCKKIAKSLNIPLIEVMEKMKYLHKS